MKRVFTMIKQILKGNVVFLMASCLAAAILLTSPIASQAEVLKSYPLVKFDDLIKTSEQRDGKKVRVRGVLHKGSNNEGTLRKTGFSLTNLINVDFTKLDSPSRSKIFSKCRPQCSVEIGGIYSAEKAGKTVGSINLKVIEFRELQ